MKKSKYNTSRWKISKPLYIDKKDKRYSRQKQQIKDKGFSDSETWALDDVICEFILPRLIRFKELNNGYPGGLSSEKWDVILDQMIFAFDWSLNHDDKKYDDLDEKTKNENWSKYEVGINQFSKYFRELWW